jgi:hypothetical protein
LILPLKCWDYIGVLYHAWFKANNSSAALNFNFTNSSNTADTRDCHSPSTPVSHAGLTSGQKM